MHQRKSNKFSFGNSELKSLIYWASTQEYFTFLNGNDFKTLNGSFPRKIFIGNIKSIESTSDSFDKLQQFIDLHNDWIYGFFSYDLKNEIEELESLNPSTIPVPNLRFFIPETVITLLDEEIEIESIYDPVEIFENITKNHIDHNPVQNKINQLACNTTKRQYLDYIRKIKESIVAGEFYEMNFCIEFTCNVTTFDPTGCYLHLNSISPMPFSSYSRYGDLHIISASPERFIKKQGNKLISQPIKGTIRRSFDKTEDEYLKQSLQTSEKERAENMMIVDLVRNDLAKSAETGSVKVDELFGIYTFKKVHQMISSVSANVKSNIRVVDIIRNAFPMGSMTGAPKVRVMQEIESMEHSSRGAYSGSVGHFSPENDFDFSVIIRSILYDAKKKKISFHVGSAITFDSDPEHEYNECMLKAESMLEVLSSGIQGQ